jgi:PAS domain-containing protein
VRVGRLGSSVARGLLVTVLYLAAAALGLQLAFVGSNLSLFWIPTGVAVAGLLTCSARKAAEAALVDSRARLSAVIDSAIDAIAAIDEQGRIVLFKAAEVRLPVEDAP